MVASAFLAGWTHPAKAVVDDLARQFGFVAPAWYSQLKADVEPGVDDPDKLSALAWSAGFTRVEVSVHDVDAKVSGAAQLARWRLGMAHLAPFVAALDRGRRGQLVAACERALAGAPPLVVPLVILAASGAVDP